MMLGQKLNTHRLFKRLAKALIRLPYAQADLRHIPHCWKPHVVAHLSNHMPLRLGVK